ncbi:MAG: hypothetical protein ACK4M9_02440 [Anaerobacillus sp.]|uniref:hypothetical protein n=1 Tax=Anaerobacillus sp. TaxID=1872506 RepID=UPI0039196736
MKRARLITLGCLLLFAIVACSNAEKTVEEPVAAEVQTEEQNIDEEETTEENEEEAEKLDAEIEEAEGIHHHDDIPYEWAATYKLKEGTYSLVFHQNEFGDESILLAFILENKNITDFEHHAAHLFEADAQEVKQTEVFHAKHEYVYNLLLNKDRTDFTFTIVEGGSYRIFAEHHPEEFKMTITDIDGNEVEAENPIEYEGHEHGHSH